MSGLTSQGSLEAQPLVKRFHGHAAVSDVSFILRPLEILGYLGPNGSGKSMTLKMLTGLIEPPTGLVLYSVCRCGAAGPSMFGRTCSTRSTCQTRRPQRRAGRRQLRHPTALDPERAGDVRECGIATTAVATTTGTPSISLRSELRKTHSVSHAECDLRRTFSDHRGLHDTAG
jgi:energy-coupling factor transporter ATP-binding protein EcfA2